MAISIRTEFYFEAAHQLNLTYESKCIKCGKCERSCTFGALKLVNGVPVIDYTKCTSCGECVTGCPTKVLVLLENVK